MIVKAMVLLVEKFASSYYIGIFDVLSVVIEHYHCMKSVQIRSYFWFVFFCIRTEYRKYEPEIIPYLSTFHALYVEWCFWFTQFVSGYCLF